MRIRFTPKDKARLKRLADLEKRNLSDWARLKLTEYCEQQEKQMVLPPLTEQQIQELIESDKKTDTERAFTPVTLKKRQPKGSPYSKKVA